MSVIRWFLRWFILAFDLLFRPSFKKRDDKEQKILDEKTKKLVLYEFAACPFCVKVRWAMRRLGLNIKIFDAKNNQEHKDYLLTRGGKVQVPCLHIINEQDEVWLYESSEIIRYLEKNFT